MVKSAVSGIVSRRDLNEEIAKVAYELYRDRGMSNGHDFDDWVRAEKIVMDRYAKIEDEDEALAASVVNKRLIAGKRTKKVSR